MSFLRSNKGVTLMQLIVKYRFILWFFVAVPSFASSETIPSIASSTKAIHISTVDWCPFICPSSAENPGLLVEYTKAIFDRAGYNLNFEVFPWSRALINMRSGKSDALLAPAKSEAPDLIYPDTEIGVQRFCFFSLNGDPWLYERPESITNRKILYPRDVFPPELDEYKSSAILSKLTYSSNYLKQAIAMLKLGRIESVLMNYYPMIEYLNNHNLSDMIKLSGCVSSQKLYLAFSPVPEKKKNNEKLLTVFEERIAELKKEQFFQKLLVKYKLD